MAIAAAAVLLSLPAAVVAVVVPASPAGALASSAPAARSASSNTVAFTYDRLHPNQTVVTSSVVFTRDPSERLRLLLSAAPSGKFVSVGATVTNISGAAVTLPPDGLRVRLTVVRNGRAISAWTLRSPVHSLAAGQSVSLVRMFAMPVGGSYEVTGSVRYLA
jgi:hypothetical protein